MRVPSLTPLVSAKRRRVCEALSFKPSHLPTRRISHTGTQSLFQNATSPTLPVASFIHNPIRNHFYIISLSLKPIWPIVTQAVRRRLFIARPRFQLLATRPETRGNTSDFLQSLLCFFLWYLLLYFDGLAATDHLNGGLISDSHLADYGVQVWSCTTDHTNKTASLDFVECNSWSRFFFHHHVKENLLWRSLDSCCGNYKEYTLMDVTRFRA